MELKDAVKKFKAIIPSDGRILHNYKAEMLLPWLVMGDTVTYNDLSVDSTFVTLDGVSCRVISCVEVNMLDEETIKICSDLYAMIPTPMLVMKSWHSKYGLDTLLFKHVKVEKI